MDRFGASSASTRALLPSPCTARIGPLACNEWEAWMDAGGWGEAEGEVVGQRTTRVWMGFWSAQHIPSAACGSQSTFACLR